MSGLPSPFATKGISYDWLIAQAPKIPKEVLDAAAKRIADHIDGRLAASFTFTVRKEKKMTDRVPQIGDAVANSYARAYWEISRVDAEQLYSGSRLSANKDRVRYAVTTRSTSGGDGFYRDDWFRTPGEGWVWNGVTSSWMAADTYKEWFDRVNKPRDPALDDTIWFGGKSYRVIARGTYYEADRAGDRPGDWTKIVVRRDDLQFVSGTAWRVKPGAQLSLLGRRTAT